MAKKENGITLVALVITILGTLNVTGGAGTEITP